MTKNYDSSWDLEEDEYGNLPVDEDDAYFTDIARSEPFRLGHVMDAVDIEEMEDEDYGIELKVKEGKKIGYVPLCDVEVTSRENSNFWPVREYAVWFANR